MCRAFRIITALVFLIGLWSHAHAQVPMTGAGKGAPGGGGSTPIAFVAGTSAASSNGSDVTTGTINSTGANFLVVAVSAFDVTGTVSDSKGNTWNTTLTKFGTNPSVKVFYCSSTSVGASHTVTYTTAGGNNPAVGFAAFSNVNATPFDTEVGTTGSSASAAGGSITPGASGALIISAEAASTSAPVPTVDSGFTIIGTSFASSGTNYGFGMAYLIETTIAAKNPTWTNNTSNPWAAVNESFKN